MKSRLLTFGVLFLVTATTRADDSAGPVSVRQVLPPAVTQGQGFAAEVYVTNTTTHPVDDVRLSGGWSVGYKLTAANPVYTPAAGNDRKAEWTLGRLNVGEIRQIRLTYAPSEMAPGTEFRSEFEVSFRGAKVDVQTIPVQRPSLDLSVTSPTVAVVGQPIRVNVSLKNPGSAEVRGITVSSKLPEGLTHPSGTELEADIGVVPAGGSEAVPLDLTPTKPGPVRAVFKIAGGGVAPVEREVQLVALDAKVELDLSGPKNLPQSWPGTYELTVRNTGTQAAPAVQLEVAVPQGFEDQNLRATEGAKFDPATRKLVWAVGDLKPGESRSVIWLGVGSRSGDLTLSASAKLGGTVTKTVDWQTRVQAGR